VGGMVAGGLVGGMLFVGAGVLVVTGNCVCIEVGLDSLARRVEV